MSRRIGALLLFSCACLDGYNGGQSGTESTQPCEVIDTRIVDESSEPIAPMDFAVDDAISTVTGRFVTTLDGDDLALTIDPIGEILVQERAQADGVPCDPVYAVSVDLALAVDDVEIARADSSVKISRPDVASLPELWLPVEGAGIADLESEADVEVWLQGSYRADLVDGWSLETVWTADGDTVRVEALVFE